MSLLNPLKPIRTLSLLSVLLLALSGLGCAEGGSGSASGSTGGTGSVAVALTDAPTDDFAEVWITVTRIDLLPGDDETGRETVFEGEETFDLLALENVVEPFAIADDVPAGTYSKLRLEVSAIELVPLDGGPSVFPRVPANGRIDLNPRGGFTVAPGDTLAVTLDVDARRSIHVVQTGNGRYQFRPQVFVEIMDAERVSRLVSVEGVIDEIDPDADPLTLRLCDVAIERRDADGRRPDACITVFVEPADCVFDSSGRVVPKDALEVGQRIAVLGRFTRDDASRFALDAEVIEIGGSAAFLTLSGVVSGEFDAASETILVDLDPAQGFVEGTTLEVDVTPSTRVFTRDGERLDPEDVELDWLVEMDGVLALGEGEPDLLRAVVLFVRAPEPEAPVAD